MLGKLDDQMDSKNYDLSTRLPPAMAGEPVKSISKEDYVNPPPPLPSDALSSNQTIGARPLLTRSMPRLPLSSVVNDLVNQWSSAFVDLASEGDTSAMCLVAQMYLHHRGYGLIKPNRSQGVQWILKAVDLNDLEAREAARRLCPQELKEHLKKKGIDNQQLLDEEAAGNHNYK
jgi:hypothetical protein